MFLTILVQRELRKAAGCESPVKKDILCSSDRRLTQAIGVNGTGREGSLDLLLFFTFCLNLLYEAVLSFVWEEAVS
jgi:hypothetical protein